MNRRLYGRMPAMNVVSGTEPNQHFAQPVAGPANGFVMPLLVDSGTKELQVEGSIEAALQDPPNDLLERNRAISRHRSARERTVTEHIVADLDQMAALRGALDRLPKLRFGPGRKYVDAYA